MLGDASLRVRVPTAWLWLRHPGIAHIYEAGTYDDGSGPVPFFAMEYIRNAKTMTQ